MQIFILGQPLHRDKLTIGYNHAI